MNFIREQVEVSTEVNFTQKIVESNQQKIKSNTRNSLLPIILSILLVAWITLSLMNNGQFLTEAVISSIVISALFFMKKVAHPRNLRKEATV